MGKRKEFVPHEERLQLSRQASALLGGTAAVTMSCPTKTAQPRGSEEQGGNDLLENTSLLQQ